MKSVKSFEGNVKKSSSEINRKLPKSRGNEYVVGRQSIPLFRKNQSEKLA
jgi:hypothetical protein